MDKEISAGQEEMKKLRTRGKKYGGTDSRQREEKGRPREGTLAEFCYTYPRARFPGLGGKCPRTAESGQGPRHGAYTRSLLLLPAPVPARVGVDLSVPGAVFPGYPRRRLLLTCWPVAGDCPGPPYAPLAPELGPGSPKSRNMPCAGCSVGSASAARVLTHPLLA